MVFVDPPYADDPTGVLAALPRLLTDGGIVVVERSTRDDLIWPEGLNGIRDKSYGETRLYYGRTA